MNELQQTQLKIIINAVLISAILAVLSIIFLTDSKPVIVGLVFGTLIAILSFQQLALAIAKGVTLPPGQAQIFVTVRYFIRLFIYAMVLFISLKADYINILGTLAGLMSIKISVLITGIWLKSR